ncbi:MAG: baseplate J/gp47 family protein [Solibacillus sp.]|uniref:baseplate J/gp47 family protein n=1 Tax=Solibacillus sp. TaxID=1909654 RepID=UPI003314732A
MTRFNLPGLELLQKAPEIIEQSMLSIIENETGITLDNTDPRRVTVKALAYFVSLERNNLEHAIKQTFLSYAVDEALDHQGSNSNTPRIEPKAARTIIKYVLDENRVSTFVVNEGTRYLVSNTYFEAIETVAIPVGTHEFEIEAQCTEVGAIGNGYLPGEITTLVQPENWVVSISNTTTTSGGAELEDDEPYAERIRIADDKYSTAGAELGYEYWAKASSQNIIDISVDSPEPNKVDIRVLMVGGTLPTETDLDLVLERVNQKKVRPMTDVVTASAPDLVSYDANTTYWISIEKSAMVNKIQANVQQAYNDYLIWQRSKMGRDVDLSELVARLKTAGASRVNIDSLMFIEIDHKSVAQAGSEQLVFGGFSE